MPLTKAKARAILLSLKDSEERLHFGQPSVFHAGKLVGRVHDREKAVALRIGSIEMRDVMLEAEPKLFYITDHYRPWPMLLARLEALDARTLKALALARASEIAAGMKKPRTRKPAAKTKAAAGRAAGAKRPKTARS